MKRWTALWIILCLCITTGASAGVPYADPSQIGLSSGYDPGMALLMARMCVDVTGYRYTQVDDACFCHDTLEAAGFSQIQDFVGETLYVDGVRVTREPFDDMERLMLDAIYAGLRTAIVLLIDNGVTALATYAASLATEKDLVRQLRTMGLDANRQMSDNPRVTVAYTENAAGEPVILIVFRGTHDAAGWLTDALTFNVGDTHVGFASQSEIFKIAAGNQAQFQLPDGSEATLSELIGRASDGERIHFVATGHSLGGALAQLFLGDLVQQDVPIDQITGYTFAAPIAYSESYWLDSDYDARAFPVYNVINAQDVVPRVGFTKTFLRDTASDFLLYLIDRDSGLFAGSNTTGTVMGETHVFSGLASDYGLPQKSLFSNHNKFLYEQAVRTEYNELYPSAQIETRAVPTVN